MRCRVCAADALPLWPGWFRCPACGSDSSSADPAAVAAAYTLRESVTGHDATPESLDANVRWFRDYRETVPGRDFLDVGHANGAALAAMQSDGWSVHGFDVNPHSDLGPHTTVAPAFRASLFPRRYDAVLCREVIEHIDGWRHFLGELFAAAKPGGICQVQTPRPMAGRDGMVYQLQHLQLFSPEALGAELRRAGFAPLDRWLWGKGQAWLLRR